MKTRKNMTLRRKLFLLILCSMLALLIGMGSIFVILTGKMQKESQKSLTDFSGEMIESYSEQRETELIENTRTSCQLFVNIASSEIYKPWTESDFRSECDMAFVEYSKFVHNHKTDENEILFVYYNGYFCVSDERDIQQTEDLINMLYAECKPDLKMPEAGYADGMEWLGADSESGEFHAVQDGNLIAMHVGNLETQNDTSHSHDISKAGVIRILGDVNELRTMAENTVAVRNEKAGKNSERAYRQAMLLMGAAMLVIIALSFVYTGRISRYLADPIEIERMRAKQEKEALEEMNRMKTAFLSDASHELKTPLAAMSGYAQNAESDLMNDQDRSAVQEKLKRISSEANRMALMVTQILDATRIEEGRMVLEKAPCDIDGLVRETAETYFAVLNRNNNRLALRIPPDLPPASADSSRLQRVFVNLISNALKHTHDGMIVVRAETEDEQFIKVSVKDTGSGISKEDMPHIWERYYKGKHSETGTGLGLYICRFIIESHGGRIWAESEPGKGTTFTFTLPVSQ